MCSLTHKVTPLHTRCCLEICSQQGVQLVGSNVSCWPHVSEDLFFYLLSLWRCGSPVLLQMSACLSVFWFCTQRAFRVESARDGTNTNNTTHSWVLLFTRRYKNVGCAAAVRRFHGMSAAVVAHIIKCYGLLKLWHGWWCNDLYACYVLCRISSFVHMSPYKVHKDFMFFTWVFIISASLNFPLIHLVLPYYIYLLTLGTIYYAAR